MSHGSGEELLDSAADILYTHAPLDKIPEDKQMIVNNP